MRISKATAKHANQLQISKANGNHRDHTGPVIFLYARPTRILGSQPPDSCSNLTRQHAHDTNQPHNTYRVRAGLHLLRGQQHAHDTNHPHNTCGIRVRDAAIARAAARICTEYRLRFVPKQSERMILRKQSVIQTIALCYVLYCY